MVKWIGMFSLKDSWMDMLPMSTPERRAKDKTSILPTWPRRILIDKTRSVELLDPNSQEKEPILNRACKPLKHQ